MSPENVTTKGIIYMIAGEPIDEDSGRVGCAHIRAARTIMEIDDKVPARGPLIHFGPVDAQGVHLPHNDALVISATVANYTVQHIFVDSEPTRRTRMVRFLVVDIPSAYNLILGRPALNTFQAAVSTYHVKPKFPVRDKVREVKGDQYIMQKIYMEAIKGSNGNIEVDPPNKESSQDST
ncbi:UNVERIFIED_CONTAM: hypothetical protein Sangu_1016800 [Sesamum angustifolium]|uniref:Uncharacterized protein n=1 Tax=Sesamum angustifolium TaxID=2727405 RepID=A0AAW2PGP5_9LAMI